MKNRDFITVSKQIANITKSLTLTKSLMVSTLIVGEPHIGKKSLVHNLFPNSIYVDASDEALLAKTLETNSEVVIYNFQNIKNIDRLDFANKRIVAISDNLTIGELLEMKFAFIYTMPSLSHRSDDVALLVKHFIDSIKKELDIDGEIELDISKVDISNNIKSLKAYVYKQVLLSSLSEEDMDSILYDYLYEKIDGNNAYREYLGLYEIPLIRAGLDRYKSQLKLSSILGLNRNTLRKKIHEYDID